MVGVLKVHENGGFDGSDPNPLAFGSEPTSSVLGHGTLVKDQGDQGPNPETNFL